MNTTYKKLSASCISMSQLMLPSNTNFSGKIHGGYILMLMDQIAFAAASKYSGSYCVTASVDRVDFLNPVEVGELLTMNASVNYIGNSSMVVGIRVNAENIQTGGVKHCNSSYFTMVAKDTDGKSVSVPRPILTTTEQVRRFHNAVKRIELRKQRNKHEQNFDYTSQEAIDILKNMNVRVEL